MGFPRVVQPLLDRQCIRCHDGAVGPDHAVDLRGRKQVKAPTFYDSDEGAQHSVSDSFLTLLPHVSYEKVGGYQGKKLPFQPGTMGSRVSPLIQRLSKDHHGLRLPAEDLQALASWIDCNAPYFSTYEEMDQPPRLARELTPKDQEAIAARIAELGAEKGHVVAFLAGGLQSQSEGTGPVAIAQNGDLSWTWPNADKVPGIPITQQQTATGELCLNFTIEGLTPGRSYTLGMTWWDFDATGRSQSVFAADGTGWRKLLDEQKLPAWHQGGEKPATVEMQLPAEALSKGLIHIQVRRNGKGGSVVSEVWVRENT